MIDFARQTNSDWTHRGLSYLNSKEVLNGHARPSCAWWKLQGISPRQSNVYVQHYVFKI